MKYSAFKINNKLTISDIVRVKNGINRDFDDLPETNLVLYCSELGLIFEATLKVNKITQVNEKLRSIYMTGYIDSGPNRQSVLTDWNKKVPVKIYFFPKEENYTSYVEMI